MKNLYLLFSFALMSIFAFGQTPQAFKYQAVARDLNGNPVISQEISVKISILSGSPEGMVEYCELHQTTSNSLGLINLEVGRGTAVTGNFAMITWGNNASFIKTEMDLAGGENFVFMGTSQLLSVPYALYSANGIRSMTTEERDAITNPTIGMQIYNINTNCLNYFNGTNWFETCGTCTPQPSNAFAGNDLYFTSDTTATYLQGNTPESGIGTWSLINGTGGIFEDINDPATIFTGLSCTSYELMWTISTPCNSKNDLVNVEFDAIPTNAFAGEDLIITTDLLSINLDANSPEVGNGYWTIIDGEGGIIENELNPVSLFTGQPCKTYELVWSIITECYISSDTVNISFFSTPTEANAGSDQLGLTGTWTTLSANAPQNGTGQWTILSGTGGIINSPTSPTSIFLGQNLQQYLLEWRIITTCDTVSDEVMISFGFVPFLTCGDTLFDTRDSRKYATVQIGEQCWMKENLEYLPTVYPPSEKSLTDPRYYVYDFHGTIASEAKATPNYQTYGVLYNWPAAINSCPTGWYLPGWVNGEWVELILYLQPTPGGEMKATGTIQGGDGLWEEPNTGATNESGFSALPGGWCSSDDSTFNHLGFAGFWWLFNEMGPEYAQEGCLSNSTSDHVNLGEHPKSEGASVRCIRGEGPPNNHVPEVPSNPTPLDGATEQDLNISLSWDCSDPDSDMNYYEVYFGTEEDSMQVSTILIYNPSYIPVNLISNTTYYWKIIAHDEKGNSSEGPVWSFTTKVFAIECGETIVDERDGKSYNTVQIGEQCWMKENLNIGIRITGTANPTNNNIIEKYCFDDTEEICGVYGGLYQWDEMMQYSTTQGVQGICPIGWHLPTDADWCTITAYLDSTINCSANGYSGTDAGGKMKEIGTTHWSPNSGATNMSGFTGLPGGNRSTSGGFGAVGGIGAWWSSVEDSAESAWFWGLTSEEIRAYRNSKEKGSSWSVRCLRD